MQSVNIFNKSFIILISFLFQIFGDKEEKNKKYEGVSQCSD